MSISDFYPFRTKPDGIQLQLLPIRGQARPLSDGSLFLYEQDSNPVAINAVIEVPERTIDDVLDVSENEDRPVKVLLTCKSVESRRRVSISPSGSTRECSLEFKREDWRGAVEFRACLVRTADNLDLPDGYANRAGAILAWSESMRVLFDEPRLPPGDYLRVAWRDFAGSEEWLQRQCDHLFAVDAATDIPVVILNQGVPHAYQVLTSRANSGRIAQIRDAAFYMIVHQVWSALIADALVRMSETRMGDEENTALALDELPPWQRRLLMDWAPKLYPEEDVEDALPRLIATTMRAGDWSRDLLYRRLPEAIQRQYRTWRGFRGLVQELESQ